MAGASAGASIFDSITTGNILSDIGNTGLQSNDVAAIFIATAQAEAQLAAEQEARRKEERKRALIIGGSLLAGMAIFLIIIYLINQKFKVRNGQQKQSIRA